ncbi:MAG: putative 3-oxoadipate enol-lactone hydrolase [Novosphingobium sp.]|nr:putative 3-oxoadipate enol-lactone hydrolase [Novosphingobium sp.]
MSGAFTVAVKGAVLSGEASGTGPPLVLIHGMAGERHDWDRLISALPTSVPTLCYDLRGFGQSSAQDGVTFSHTDDLLALLDARGVDQAAILGVSMGGGVALNFALSHPKRVRRLVLISPAIIGWEWSDEWKALWRGVAEPARSGDMALARERWLDHPMFASLCRDPAAAAELRRSIGAYSDRQWVRDWQADELPDLDRLHTLAMPCLLLSGALDVPDMRLIADVFEGAAPGAERIDYLDAGHMLHLERAAGVAAAVSAFLSEPYSATTVFSTNEDRSIIP